MKFDAKVTYVGVAHMAQVIQNRLVARHGEILDLGACLVGTNLNLLAVRGNATLDVLADISAPDVFDQVENPQGTQRALRSKHAAECYEYAMDALAKVPEEEPCCFPEVLLNARDENAVELYNLDDPGELYELSSFSSVEELESLNIGLRIRVEDLEFPKPTKSPQISRVDGNHRLDRADSVLEELATSGEEADFPMVPFSLFIGMGPLQEAALFRDINGEHVGMETAHLDSLSLRIFDHEEMKMDPKRRALWVAHKLTEPGRAFEDMVFMGGSKEGLKKQGGTLPPIKINSLKSTIAAQLKAAPTVAVNAGHQPEMLIELLDRFWKAVRDEFPEAWQNKRDYILLQAIGLGAFAKFGGVILDRAWLDGSVQQEDLSAYLKPVAGSVPLKREEWPGVAGAGGQQQVADHLIAAATPGDVLTQKNVQQLAGESEDNTALDP